MAESSVHQPTRRGWLQLRPRPNNICSDRIVIGILGFLTDHDNVHLREMRQAVTSYEDPCRFFTDLQLQYLWQRVQPSWHQKEAWGYPWTASALHLPDLQPFLPENGPLSPEFVDPPEKNGPDITDRTKENYQEETVTPSWTQPKAATYRVTTTKDPPRKEPSFSRHGGSTWRSRDQSLVYTTFGVHPDRGSDRQPCPRQIQLYIAWDDSVHLYRDGTSDL